MKWTLKAGSKEFGLHQETLRKRLVDAGHAPARGSRYSTLQLANAINGSLVKERTRLTKAEADEKEAELAVMHGDLITMDAVNELLAEALTPIRSHMLAMPANISAQVNPADPLLAQRLLQAEVERILRGVDYQRSGKPRRKNR